MRQKYWLALALILILVAGCAPIEGLDGEEDNLPAMETEEEPEVIETTEEEVVPEEPEVTEETPESDTVAVDEVNFVRIKADALNVRQAPGIENEKLTKIYEGQIYEVLAIQPDSEGLPWYQLTTPDKMTGWVSSEYCVPGETYDSLVVDTEE